MTPKPRSKTLFQNLDSFGALIGSSGQRFNQVFAQQGGQKILLSTDSSANSTALADLKQTAAKGVLAPSGQTTQQAASSAPKPGGSFLSKYKTPLLIGGAAVLGLVILGGVFVATKR